MLLGPVCGTSILRRSPDSTAPAEPGDSQRERLPLLLHSRKPLSTGTRRAAACNLARSWQQLAGGADCQHRRCPLRSAGALHRRTAQALRRTGQHELRCRRRNCSKGERLVWEPARAPAAHTALLGLELARWGQRCGCCKRGTEAGGRGCDVAGRRSSTCTAASRAW